MKPETEYIARQLAGMVLEDRDTPRGHIGDAGQSIVTMEMRGMMRTIRREILIDHAELAGRIADEIEKQSSALRLDEHIAATVKREIDGIKRGLDQRIAGIIERELNSRIQSAVHEMIGITANTIAGRAMQKLLDATRESEPR